MCSVCMIQPAFVNTEITEIISFKEDFQMKKQEKNGKRSAVVFGRFCSAIALCTIIVTLAATALPIIALSVRGRQQLHHLGVDTMPLIICQNLRKNEI